ncbi:AAA family ATPase [Streptosporangium amethystogenes]|uniref:AAA family ATPase n=1 Tax=Streptosporangium amethystogenes TaxID=2002 RepID=UPI00069105E0|nr:SMC family ATPase [Streptosporangium amethystogenes]
MRPLHLTFCGLRSYPGQIQTLDFTGKSLIAILGDTGAGKTTILEAITLALYGASSWSNKVKELVAEGATSMTVDLTFSHHDHTWRVRRVYYANSRPSTHLLQNLDTEEEIDDSRAVNRRIEHLLKLRRDEFQAAVLLPQGRFDRLLTATDTERTELLKGIFGTRFLEATRARAERRRDTIRELLHKAQLTRRGYLDDPRASAEHATAAAQTAQQRADRLSTALSTMNQLQTTARQHTDRLNDLDVAIRQLSDPASQPNSTVLDAVAQAEQNLDETAQQLISRHEQTRTDYTRAREALDKAATQGITADAVAAARAMLADLPSRQATLHHTETRLATEQQDLSDDHDKLEDMAVDIERRHRQAEQMTAHAEVVQSHADRAVTAATKLQNVTRTALAAAITVGQAAAAKTAVASAYGAAQRRLPALRAAHQDAQTALHAAAHDLEGAKQAEAAHLAGQGLHAGDSCLVCAQPLPAAYQPPAPLDPIRLHALQKAHTSAGEAFGAAGNALREGMNDVTAAEQGLATVTDDHTIASDRLAERLAEAQAAAACPDLATVAPADTAPHHDADAFTHRLKEDTEALVHNTSREAGNAGADADLLATRLSEPLCAPAHHLARSLSEAAAAAWQKAHAATADARGATQILTARKDDYTKKDTAYKEAHAQHTIAVETMHKSLNRLPAAVRAVLPATPSTVTDVDVDVDVTAAMQVCEELGTHLTQAQGELEQATTTLAQIETDRVRLDHRRQTDITAPLTALLAAATTHRGTLHSAQALLGADSVPVPASVEALEVAQLSVPVVQRLCDALAAASAALVRQLRTEHDKVTTKLNISHARLDDQARHIQTDDESGDHAGLLVRFASGVSLREPQALTPLSEAIGAARQTHTEQMSLASRAHAQIEPAEQLDHAIECATSHLNMLTLLHGQLADGKFLTYLTERRTRTLLILASELFSRLSSGRYGFTDDFRIASLATRTARSPKTLSGGETFLASLALALALVELHSRNGARLGSLFLDEGFGALDSATLASALSVLRAESSGDKLVTVISHLHAVAEAVDDVLWINRTPAGSEARWLTASQREALIYDHAQSGLLDLADQIS